MNQTLGTTHSRRINSLVTDIVSASWAASGEDGKPQGEIPAITMSPRVQQAMVQLREYMFEQLYLPLGRSEESEAARDIVRLLYRHFVQNPEEVPPPYFGQGATPQQAATDYLAGMTDHYAIRLAERLRPGISRGVFAGVTLD